MNLQAAISRAVLLKSDMPGSLLTAVSCHRSRKFIFGVKYWSMLSAAVVFVLPMRHAFPRVDASWHALFILTTTSLLPNEKVTGSLCKVMISHPADDSALCQASSISTCSNVCTMALLRAASCTCNLPCSMPYPKRARDTIGAGPGNHTCMHAGGCYLDQEHPQDLRHISWISVWVKAPALDSKAPNLVDTSTVICSEERKCFVCTDFIGQPCR